MAKEKLQIQVDVQGAALAKKSLNKLGTASRSVGGSLTAMLGPIALVTTAIYAVKEGFEFVIEKGAEFEKGMANLESISGASAIALGNLSDKDMELGGSTAFTAKEVTDLMVEYAKLGFNPELHRKTCINLIDGDYWDHAAHDFILTRNHHGAGFWDGDWFEPFGSLLTDLALTFPELELYLDDDGLVSAAN